MSNISWNYIYQNAVEFAVRWKNEKYEKGEAQSFWTELLAIYGIDRKRWATFEQAIKKLDKSPGYIDMFWEGMMLVEQKSAGRSLEKALCQGLEYLNSLEEHQLPKIIVACDFQNFEILDLNTNKITKFTLSEFPKKTKIFAFLIGREQREITEQDPVNVKAAEKMAQLHDELLKNGYVGEDLELLLVRLLFCLFADDSGIFERGIFDDYVAKRTSEDGSDFGNHIIQIFQTLNTPPDKRMATLDEDLAAFPYVNGGMFDKPISTIPSFSSRMRAVLFDSGWLDWGSVSPAIFGSLFQGVMDEEIRRHLGAHYTSETNILRLIKPLFLDRLHDEFENIRHDKKKLQAFHTKIASLKFLDPACGCGNFLVIAYRELRILEIEILKELHMTHTGEVQLGLLNIDDLLKVSIDQMYGIEIEEFPSLIAQTALWLTEHQMNNEVANILGKVPTDLPLKSRPNIIHDNALEIRWENIISPSELNYILGNPPFVGAANKDETQASEIETIFEDIKGAGKLDYVAAWYKRAAEYMTKNKDIRAAFVSTNSITQGEQVSILWKYLLSRGIHINFAHQTFKWTNDAKGKAAVFCVIVGFSYGDDLHKALFTYREITGEPTIKVPKRINPYLVDAPDILIDKRRTSISQVPEMVRGSIPYDDGNLLFDHSSLQEFLNAEPDAKKFIRRYGGSFESLNDAWRYCLWLKGADPAELRRLPNVLKRVEAVRNFRSNSKTASVHSRKDTPTLFGDIRQPDSDYLLVPRVSSERRNYLPISFVDKNTIVADSGYAVPSATLYHFGVLISRMHMAWMRYVCGRLKSDYRYSKDIVYNNFVWPKTTQDQRDKVGTLAKEIIEIREARGSSTLADLYDPRTMPSDLLKAHLKLDRYVGSLYNSAPLSSDPDRVELLFKKYQAASP